MRATYTLVKQALPAIEKFGAFGPAQQTALAQLAMQYCNVLVDDNTLRARVLRRTRRIGHGHCGVRHGRAARTRRIAICSSTALITKAIGTGLALPGEWRGDPR